MQLTQAFRTLPHEVVAFVGAGGKTMAMFRLADELVAQGKRVVVTTTTHLSADQVGTHPSTRFASLTPLRHAQGRSESAQDDEDFIARVRDALKTHSQILVVGNDVADNKVAGVPPGFIDQLAALESIDAVLYEADGARMLPFKAPAAHEPVVASSTTLLVSVIGVTVFGTALDDAHVHRAETVARLAGTPMGETVTPLIAARVIAHSDGGLKNKPDAARVIALVNQVETDSQLNTARELAHLLLGYAAIDAVSIGAVKSPGPIRETHRRVAAIVLAAGAGTRMEGRIKQLLPWRGKTFVENAIAIVAQSNVNEMIVVLGARAEEIRAVLRNAPALDTASRGMVESKFDLRSPRDATSIVLNREWEGGHSTSIRAGLNALSPRSDAAIFINADQPLLTSEVINTIIQRYRETDAPIIAPYYAGKRGSPVLFHRQYFPELASLQGEQGGRELLSKYSTERVEFADASLGYDVDTFEEYRQLT